MGEDKIAIDKNKKTCFIITPIGDDNDPIRRHIDGLIDECIIPVLSDTFVINVAHRMSSPGSITNQVIAEIYNSDLVIANLTNLNANVMYELAFRHAVKKPVIIIMQKGTGTLPFDTISERTIFYTNDFKGAIELKERLKKAVEIIDNIEDSDIDNPIYNALERIMIKENVIKNISSKTGEDANILKYILDSLQRIENRPAVIQSAARNIDEKKYHELSKTLVLDSEMIFKEITEFLIKIDDINIDNFSVAAKRGYLSRAKKYKYYLENNYVYEDLNEVNECKQILNQLNDFIESFNMK